MFRLIVLVALAGCATDLDPIGHDDDDVVELCETVVASTVPSDGAADAYYRGAVEFVLSEPDPDATVTATFPGELSVDGNVVTYTPTGPLAPDTAYEVTLDYCGGSPTIGFRTSELGAPLAADLVGRTYQIDLIGARFAGAAGLSEVAGELIARALLVQVTAIDVEGVHLRVAMPDETDAAQAPCTTTLELPPADFALTPYFTLSATDLEFASSDTTIDLASLEFAGTLSPGGTWMGGGTFAAVLDARDVAGLIDTSPEGLCSIAVGLGLPCGACADGEPMCVSISADGIEGEWLDGVEIQAITDPSLLPECS